MKLFSGEYEPANHRLSINNARIYFLTAVRNHIPEVLEELYEHHLPLYQKVGKPSVKWRQLEIGQGEIRELRDNILNWAKHWRLEAEWCLEVTLTTLYYWSWFDYKGKPDLLMWQGSGNAWTAVLDHHERALFFEHSGWEPTLDTRKKIKDEVSLAFNEHLEKYLDYIESIAAQRGFVKSKQKNEIEHFDWLACFQVKGMSYEEVRDMFKHGATAEQMPYLSDDTKAFRQAINALARFISLPLRTDGTRPGRRSKVK